MDKLLNSFLYFENSGRAVNFNEVESFKVESVDYLHFFMRSGNIIAINNVEDIKGFIKNILLEGNSE